MPDISITLTLDAAQVAAVAKRLDKLRDQTPRAIAGAINKTLPHVRTLIKNAAAKEILLPKNEILHTMKVLKARATHLSGRVYVHRKKISLMRFKPKQNDAGVTVRIRPGGPTQFDHAFIATMPSGHEGVFVRKDGPGHREMRWSTGRGRFYSTQLPIKELAAPTVVDVLAENPGTLAGVQDDAQAKLAQNLDSQVDWLLSRGEARD